MSIPLELEFVLVSADYALMNAVSAGVKKYGGKFILVPTAEAARDCLKRRKIDGVFVDTEVPGALAVMAGIRKGTSNNKAVIFACVTDAKENTLTLSAGANFLLRKPLTEESVALHITIAKELLERERRRYFRHAVSIPVVLKDGEVVQNARMTDLSEGGMAVRIAKPLKHSTVIDFSFELAVGTTVSGKGQVAWISSEGLAGVVLQIFQGKTREHLEAWLAAQEQVGSKEKGDSWQILKSTAERSPGSRADLSHQRNGPSGCFDPVLGSQPLGRRRPPGAQLCGWSFFFISSFFMSSFLSILSILSFLSFFIFLDFLSFFISSFFMSSVFVSSCFMSFMSSFLD
jgi:hypothetical protein